VSTAYLRQVQGDLEAARSFLQRALAADKNSPMALLHMGYLLLCQEQLELAVQYLQKCLQQPLGTLAYGASQKGSAHLYLCVAHHWRRPPEQSELDPIAQEHFQSAYTLQPDLRRALSSLGAPGPPGAHLAAAGLPRSGVCGDLGAAEAGSCLVSGNPPRMGLLDLSPRQASALLPYAVACGCAPASTAATPRARTEAVETPKKPAPLASALAAQPPTLVGTSSTTAPSSPGPSRDASDPALLPGDSATASIGDCLSSTTTALALSRRLPPEKILRLADVELGECISRGEFAVVHRGTLQSSQRDVVVKALHRRDCSYDGDAAAELLAEICVIAELSHPRIVAFVGACLEPTCAALVTELAPGGNLHQALHVRQRRLCRGECFQLATELLEGVLYLHSQHPMIAHLDLKSMNLVLDAEGRHLQICDFGLARALGGSEGHGGDPRERPPSRAGSPRYMAPECYDSSIGAVTEKADVWSSGCVLIEIFGARLPYAECGNVQQILSAMLVHRCGPCIPTSIEAPVRSIVASMLAFEAHQRPAICQVLPQLQAAACGCHFAASGAGGAAGDTSRFLWVSP